MAVLGQGFCDSTSETMVEGEAMKEMVWDALIVDTMEGGPIMVALLVCQVLPMTELVVQGAGSRL